MSGDHVDFAGSDVYIFVQEFEKELQGQSDRGLVIVGTAGLDMMLEGLLGQRLNGEVKREEMFGGNAPLNDFSARIKLALSLGLISRNEQQELMRVRKIRNKVAHQVDASLSSDSLGDACMALSLCTKLYVPPVIPMADLGDGSKGIPLDWDDPTVVWPLLDLNMPNADDPRERFAATIRVLLRILAARALDEPNRMPPPSDFAYPEEPLKKSLAHVESQLKQSEALLQRLRDIRDELRSHGQSIEEDRDNEETADDVQRNKMVMRVAEYSNEVVRRSRLAKR
jgi:hypothetical protein